MGELSWIRPYRDPQSYQESRNYAQYASLLFLYGSGTANIATCLTANMDGFNIPGKQSSSFDREVEKCLLISQETGIALKMWNYISRFKGNLNNKETFDSRNFWVFRD